MFSILFFFRIAAFLLPLPTMVDGKLIMTVILNGGVLPTVEGYDCNENDSQLITTTIGADDDDEDDGRRLMTYSKRCRDACKFYAAKTCRTTGCVGYRRRKLQKSKRAIRMLANRKLDETENGDDEAICAGGMAALNSDLDNLLPQLSEGCRSVVQNMRAVSCFDDVRFALVESFSLWNADTDTIVQANIQNNTSFCYTNSTMNIEAVTNACVDEMDLSIKGPVSQLHNIESSGPFSIFGHEGENDFLGRNLPVGTYTIQSTLYGSLTPTSKVTFMVKNC